ncbi:hypothetical protein HDU96_004921 [Phlyctochytrium bullatum]|nr:hypothetical protein HDU96_004921 [Phlyctochytrium bullatum]
MASTSSISATNATSTTSPGLASPPPPPAILPSTTAAATFKPAFTILPLPPSSSDPWTINTGEVFDGLRIWAIPAERNLTYPRGNYVGINAAVQLVLDNPPPCDPQYLSTLFDPARKQKSVALCGLPDLDTALRMCDMFSTCTHVVDRNSTFRWRDVDQRSRFYPIHDSALRGGDSYTLQYFYAFYSRPELPLPKLSLYLDYRPISSPPAEPLTFPVIPYIFKGSALTDAVYSVPGSLAPPSTFNVPVTTGLVVTVHFLVLVLLAFRFWATHRRPGEGLPLALVAARLGARVPVGVVDAGTRRGEWELEVLGAGRGVPADDAALPSYSASQAPAPAASATGLSPTAEAEQVLGQAARKKNTKDDVMYI